MKDLLLTLKFKKKLKILYIKKCIKIYFLMSYTNSSNMGSYIYGRNYGKPMASEKLVETNKQYLRATLPISEHHKLDLYLDPGGNISRNLMGQITQDINKVRDASAGK